MRKLVLLSLLVLLVGVSGPVQAAITLEFTGLVSENPTVGSHWTYQPTVGDTVNLSLTLDDTSSYELLGYFFSVDNYASSGGSAIGFSNDTYSGVPGTDYQYYGPTFDDQGVLETAYYDVADELTRFKFNYEGPGNVDSELTFNFASEGHIAELSIYSSGMSAVPVPAAVWLLGSGLVGLAGLRKRMKN